MVEDIKFIKTDKEGIELQVIQESYPNSIINVNSKSEKNVYVGTDRITNNYNIGVVEDSITNNVGGMSSGIHASELKGKSISDILDIILFAANNELTLSYVQVVDRIDNLSDSTLEDIYKGMLVYVFEDNSLYILLDDVNIEWQKIGPDIEDIKASAKKLSSSITVAGLSGGFGAYVYVEDECMKINSNSGLSGSLGANIHNGMIYTTDNTIEDILRDLLCREIYPNVSLSTTNPTISFGGLYGATASNHKNIMEVGSVLNLNPVSVGSASISECYRVGNGFSYGYSSDNDCNKDGDLNPPVVDGESSLVGVYSLIETYSPTSIGSVRTVSSSKDNNDVKFPAGSVVIGLGCNTISFISTSPSGVYSHPEYPEYYVVSNLGNTDSNNKLEKSPVLNGVLNSIADSTEISVIGVYPVFVNISSGVLIDDTIKMNLTKSNIFEFDVPSEVASGNHFTFDYPATHSIVSFEIKDISGNFVKYESSYDAVSEIITKDINENEKNVSYKRLQTSGKLQGKGTYKITLSKGLDI